jgi:hypothetical protein
MRPEATARTLALTCREALAVELKALGVFAVARFAARTGC